MYMYSMGYDNDFKLTWAARSTRILENEVRDTCSNFSLGTNLIPIPGCMYECISTYPKLAVFGQHAVSHQLDQMRRVREDE